MQKSPKHILFGVLNWGLGHAARSIPIIQTLQKRGHEVCVASDGDALQLLKKSLHNVDFFELQEFEIRYAAKRKNFRRKIISQLKDLKEKATLDLELIEALAEERKFDLIISDNAFGVRSKKVKSIYITHQLNVLSGWTTFFTRFLHHQSMKSFDEVWVPDVEDEPNLSGKIGHLNSKSKLTIRYIGPLSRLSIHHSDISYQFAFILSGPEPQRQLLEDKILKLADSLQQASILVRGSFKALDQSKAKPNSTLEIKNYCTSAALEKIINSSKIVVCRSGYTSLMDLLKLKKQAIYIPTPGQFEQEYLGEHISKMGWGKVIDQDNFGKSSLQQNFDSPSNFPVFNQQLLLEALEANSI